MDRMTHHFDSAPASDATGTMAGFDAEFTDIIDYILRITYRIWEGKQVGLCYDYYSEDCPVYTLAGLTIGAEEVTQNTLNTLAAFPDRTLHADNIIWGGDDNNGYHTSHLISTSMTNMGTSDMGPATHEHATISVIAHCVVKDNRIIEEWLVRDNFSLAEQLGFEPEEVAMEKAAAAPSPRFEEWKANEIARLIQSVSNERKVLSGTAEQDPKAFIETTLHNIWNARMVGDVSQAYAENARVHASANRDLRGHIDIQDFYLQFLGTLSNVRVSVDYLCDNSANNNGIEVAARWTLTGDHTGTALYGEPSGAAILILGESHYQIKDGLIQEEWTVFDELSVLTQIYRATMPAMQNDDFIRE
ncbi:MAG: ester cyclase [Pseudomonadales bacterium]